MRDLDTENIKAVVKHQQKRRVKAFDQELGQYASIRIQLSVSAVPKQKKYRRPYNGRFMDQPIKRHIPRGNEQFLQDLINCQAVYFE